MYVLSKMTEILCDCVIKVLYVIFTGTSRGIYSPKILCNLDHQRITNRLLVSVTNAHYNLGECSLPHVCLGLTIVGKTLVGYKRGRPLPVLPIMGRPLPVLPRIRPRISRGTQRVPHDGMPRQTSTFTRAIRLERGDMPSQ